MKTIRFVAGAALVFGLAACDIFTPGAIRPVDHVSPAFGNSNLHNLALQAADPAPKAPVGPTAMDGKRAALALGRYQTGKVIVPAIIGTDVGSSGGGSK
ncbi:MAG: hypothetical protein IID54_06205 [Proteobacteria bacterium]|nr:hypothetical protein [Pseudomonadota bacterium]